MTPWGIVATTVDEHTIELSWVNNPGFGLYTINIDAELPPGPKNRLVNASSTASSHLFTNLDSGTVYSFVMVYFTRKNDLNKYSEPSDPVVNCTGKLLHTCNLQVRGFKGCDIWQSHCIPSLKKLFSANTFSKYLASA